MKHWQATAEAAHQDATLHQPWRRVYSEDKIWSYSNSDRASLRKVILCILSPPQKKNHNTANKVSTLTLFYAEK